MFPISSNDVAVSDIVSGGGVPARSKLSAFAGPFSLYEPAEEGGRVSSANDNTGSLVSAKSQWGKFNPPPMCSENSSSDQPPRWGQCSISLPRHARYKCCVPNDVVTSACLERGCDVLNDTDGFVYAVCFKRTPHYYLRSHGDGVRSLEPGTVVRVQADRGFDVGKLVKVFHLEDFVRLVETTTAGGARILHDARRLIGPSSKDEADQLSKKADAEHEVVTYIRTIVEQRRMPLDIVDAEYQFDQNKLTIFFESDTYVHFSELVREIYKVYKTRIWLEQIGGSGSLTRSLSQSNYGVGDGSRGGDDASFFSGRDNSLKVPTRERGWEGTVRNIDRGVENNSAIANICDEHDLGNRDDRFGKQISAPKTPIKSSPAASASSLLTPAGPPASALPAVSPDFFISGHNRDKVSPDFFISGHTHDNSQRLLSDKKSLPSSSFMPPADVEQNPMFCPITQELMGDPVLASDGYSYDRHAIVAWLQHNNCSPLTRKPFANKGLAPNHTLRLSINAHKATMLSEQLDRLQINK